MEDFDAAIALLKFHNVGISPKEHFDLFMNIGLFCSMMSSVKKMLIVVVVVLTAMNVSGQSSQLVIKKTGPDYYIEHKVQAKENWYSIGRVYLLSPKVISAFNELSMDKGLSIGQQIKIPLTADNFNQSDNAAFTGPAIVHIVAQGEGLLRLANVYKVTMEQLREWNRLTSDQLKVNSNLIIGFLQAPGAGNIQPASPIVKEAQPIKPSSGDQLQKTNTASENQAQKQTAQKQPVVNTPVSEKPAQPSTTQQQTAQVNASVYSTGTSSAASATGFFAGVFLSQSKEGKQQKMETPAYGVFKSTSGWQDAKYYILMNNVVPGTVVRITSRNTGRQIYAKVLGAVPPGKESEGLLLRISNAAASALGVPNGEPGVFELVWSN